jgi:hypothetical protein
MIYSSRAVWVDVEFRKSSFSGGASGSCVEVARDEAVFGIRDSKNVSGPVLMLGAAQGVGFLKAVQGSDLWS